jgi:hypothetical protein
MRAAGAACLAAHLIGLGWLAPLLTALVAASDHEHQVLLSVNGEGARVVLAHDAARQGMEPGHEHCVMAAILVALSAEVPGGPDHVLAFPSGIGLLGNTPQGTHDPQAGPAPDFNNGCPLQDSIALAARAARPAFHDRSAPRCAPGAVAHSTVLRC